MKRANLGVMVCFALSLSGALEQTALGHTVLACTNRVAHSALDEAMDAFSGNTRPSCADVITQFAQKLVDHWCTSKGTSRRAAINLFNQWSSEGYVFACYGPSPNQ